MDRTCRAGRASCRAGPVRVVVGRWGRAPLVEVGSMDRGLQGGAGRVERTNQVSGRGRRIGPAGQGRKPLAQVLGSGGWIRPAGRDGNLSRRSGRGGGRASLTNAGWQRRATLSRCPEPACAGGWSVARVRSGRWIGPAGRGGEAVAPIRSGRADGSGSPVGEDDQARGAGQETSRTGSWVGRMDRAYLTRGSGGSGVRGGVGNCRAGLGGAI
ncbi:hypothetical protein EV650_5529 [Kribbella kalugense]|uniref:Uncharacterized protein n=1 Tax=Kribbella kalugense TaxID=2512221 RepID=A0A4R7ZM54_9ACTN|nr:hypothetical protein EV650_5529 [Kribbella kalugense]